MKKQKRTRKDQPRRIKSIGRYDHAKPLQKQKETYRYIHTPGTCTSRFHYKYPFRKARKKRHSRVSFFRVRCKPQTQDSRNYGKLQSECSNNTDKLTALVRSPFVNLALKNDSNSTPCCKNLLRKKRVQPLCFSFSSP